MTVELKSQSGEDESSQRQAAARSNCPWEVVFPETSTISVEQVLLWCCRNMGHWGKKRPLGMEPVDTQFLLEPTPPPPSSYPPVFCQDTQLAKATQKLFVKGAWKMVFHAMGSRAGKGGHGPEDTQANGPPAFHPWQIPSIVLLCYKLCNSVNFFFFSLYVLVTFIDLSLVSCVKQRCRSLLR